MNTYGYVGGNPVGWVDPLGLVVGHVDPEFNDDIRRIRSTQKGSELWRSIKDDDLVVNIYEGKSHCDNYTRKKYDKNGNLTGYDVYVYNGEHDHFKLPGRKEGVFIHFTPSTTRTLAHELGHTRGTRDDGGSAIGSFFSVMFGGKNTHNMNNVHEWENPIMTPLDGIERTGYGATSKNQCGCR